MFLKLANLYTAITTLYAKFPDLKADAVALWNVIEAEIVGSPWKWSALTDALTAAEKLVSDFAANWDGGQGALADFVAALKSLFGIN